MGFSNQAECLWALQQTGGTLLLLLLLLLLVVYVHPGDGGCVRSSGGQIAVSSGVSLFFS